MWSPSTTARKPARDLPRLDRSKGERKKSHPACGFEPWHGVNCEKTFHGCNWCYHGRGEYVLIKSRIRLLQLIVVYTVQPWEASFCVPIKFYFMCTRPVWKCLGLSPNYLTNVGVDRGSRFTFRKSPLFPHFIEIQGLHWSVIERSYALLQSAPRPRG